MASTIWRENALYTGFSETFSVLVQFFRGDFWGFARGRRMATAGWRGDRFTGISLETHNIFELASLATHNIFNFAFFANVDARP